MKQLVLSVAVYGLPAAVVLGAFVAGHSASAPELTALETFRAERAAMTEDAARLGAASGLAAGLAAGMTTAAATRTALAPPTGAAAVAPLGVGTGMPPSAPSTSAATAPSTGPSTGQTAAQTAAQTAEGAETDPALSLPPVLRYFSFDSPFAGNAGPGSSLFSMELSLSTWQSPLVADLFLARLTEIQPTLRGLILAELADVSAADLRNIQARIDFAARLRDVLNAHLAEIGADPAIEAVIVTSFLIT